MGDGYLMQHSEREYFIGEVTQDIFKHYSKKELNTILENPWEIPSEDFILEIMVWYKVQRRTALEWIRCAQYLLRTISDVKEIEVR
jgi:hypothetical protein